MDTIHSVLELTDFLHERQECWENGSVFFRLNFKEPTVSIRFPRVPIRLHIFNQFAENYNVKLDSIDEIGAVFRYDN